MEVGTTAAGGGACVLLGHTCVQSRQTWLACLCWTKTKLLVHQHVEPAAGHWFCLRVLCGPQSLPTKTLDPTPTPHPSAPMSSRTRKEEEGASTVKVTLISSLPPFDPSSPQNSHIDALPHLSQQDVAAVHPTPVTRAPP